MKKGIYALAGLIIVLVLLVVTGSIFTVREDSQVILTQFGKPVGNPIVEPGLKFKLPFIQVANQMEKRVLEWDGQSTQMPTRDKLYIKVDTFARWEIEDPLEFFEKLRDPRTALSRLDDILGSETRNMVAKHDLIEIIRTTKDRQPQQPEDIGEILGEQGSLEPIRIGRSAIEKEVHAAAKGKLEDFGIRLLDVRFKRINYTREVESRIFERMISERQQIAERFRSEGAGEAARIKGNMEKEVKTIESEAYKKVQAELGRADAESTRIYAEAYGGTKEREEFYRFTKTLEAYQDILGADTSLILTTDSDLFRMLKGHQRQEREPAVQPAGKAPAVQPQVEPAAQPEPALEAVPDAEELQLPTAGEFTN
ncbi:protease modulator HflC [Roseibacillus persicicus]|uniref:protease modulator HflC n=1 Tax=Roseibacillus persicicus TaxID=454148 RepID=UPI00398A6CBC